MKETWQFLQRTLFSDDPDIRVEAWGIAVWAIPIGIMMGMWWGRLFP